MTARMPPDRIIVGVDMGLTYTGELDMQLDKHYRKSETLDDYLPQGNSCIVGAELVTGVAFCATDWSTPRIINRWPGINEIRNKVPTAVGYRAGTKVFTSWGFGCPPPGKLERGEAVKDCFKLFLDPEFLEKTFKDSAGCPVGRYGDVRSDDVRDWYKDFLTGLYKHIGEYISSSFELADWGKHTVDFLFSVPTTWEGSVTNEFKKIVKEAGFGKDSEGHSVNIRLTEAEAAAVYTAASPHNHIPLSARSGDSQSVNESTAKGSEMREGNIILVCDSGGGTTVCATQDFKPGALLMLLLRMSPLLKLFHSNTSMSMTKKKWRRSLNWNNLTKPSVCPRIQILQT